MRHIIVVSFAATALAGCASFTVPDFLSPAPPVTMLQLESLPAGAEARTSAGPACQTPCAVSVPAAPLTVTYTLDKHEPQTVAVQPIRQTVVNPHVEAGGSAYIVDLDPNPVYAELAPLVPQKRTTKRPPKRVAKRQPAEPAASPVPPAATSSPFPSR